MLPDIFCFFFPSPFCHNTRLTYHSQTSVLHFASGKIPDCFWDHVHDAMEEEPEDLDTWISGYPKIFVPKKAITRKWTNSKFISEILLIS